MSVKLIGEKAMNHVVSHLEGVHSEVGDAARRVEKNAERRLAMHHDTGAAHITRTEGDVDWFVNLVDDAALSIEFGHWVKGKYEDKERPQYVPGLYILSTGAGLDATPKSGPRRKGK